MRLAPDGLRTLSAVLRTGSFEAAASELRITQSAVSQRIKHLEEKVGARLILRDSPCVATETGQRLVAHAEQIEALEKALAKELELESGTGPIPIRIAVTADSVATWFFDALHNQSEYLIDLHIDNQDYSDSLLRKGQVVGAITANGEPIAGCDCHSLGTMVYVPTATPDFFERHFKDGVTLKTLATAPFMRFNSKDHVQLQWIEKYFGAQLAPPFHNIASKTGYMQANLAGLGWGMQHVDLVSEHLEQGRLIKLLPDAEIHIPLYWQTSRIWRGTLKNLTQCICQIARKRLPQS